jgi:hypothetical protein
MISTLANATLPELAIADYLATGGFEHHRRNGREVTEQARSRMAFSTKPISRSAGILPGIDLSTRL